MTVTVLYEWEKKEAAGLYKTRFHTIERLANYFNVSTTTMHRVLKEQKVILPKPTLSIEQHKMLVLLKEAKISSWELTELLKGYTSYAKRNH